MPPCYIVAELSANHGQDFDHACALMRAAAECGADAVKVQTYTADSMTLDLPTADFRARNAIFQGRSLHSLYEEGAMPWEWQPRLQALAHELGMEFFSTPFDAEAVAFLESLNVPRYKVASYELVDMPLLRSVAATGKPVILSTGMATLAEIDEAVTELRSHGCGPLTLLKCTSAYPAPPEEANLRTIPHLAAAFHCQAGLSDHTPGTAVAVAAVALGAVMVEKHFTLDRNDKGLDSAFSLEPAEFRQLVQQIRMVEKALGEVCYEITPKQALSRQARRSLYVVRDMRQGEAFTPDNVRSIRPGAGLHTRHLGEVLGRRAAREIARGTPLAWELMG